MKLMIVSSGRRAIATAHEIVKISKRPYAKTLLADRDVVTAHLRGRVAPETTAPHAQPQ
jgi:hypothetical protein